MRGAFPTCFTSETSAFNASSFERFSFPYAIGRSLQVVVELWYKPPLLEPPSYPLVQIEVGVAGSTFHIPPNRPILII